MVEFRAILVALLLIAIIVVPRVRRNRQRRAVAKPSANPDEWFDLPLRIISAHPATGGGHALELSHHDGRFGSISIELGANWTSGTPFARGVTIYSGEVRFLPPAEGDRGWGMALEAAYRTGVGKVHQHHPTVFQAVSLRGDPYAPEEGPVRLKLFFAPEIEAKYAEAFFHFDLATGEAEFAEKDPVYRLNLVRAFIN